MDCFTTNTVTCVSVTAPPPPKRKHKKTNSKLSQVTHIQNRELLLFFFNSPKKLKMGHGHQN